MFRTGFTPDTSPESLDALIAWAEANDFDDYAEHIEWCLTEGFPIPDPDEFAALSDPRL